MDAKQKGSPMDKIKEGVSVKEIESFARKYTLEGFVILALIIATLSSAFGFFTGPAWSVVFAGIGAILSVAFPEYAWKILKPMLKFTCKDEKSIQIIVGVVRVLFAIFVPFILFLEIALLGGLYFHNTPEKEMKKAKKSIKKEEPPKNEEEHL